MNWSWLGWAYTFCLTIGTAYTFIAFFMGHAGHGDAGGHDAGGHGGGGHDGHGHGSGTDNYYHFPLFSPIAIAVFLTAFGGGGMIGAEVLKGHHPAMSLAVAVGSGLFFGITIAAAMAMVFKQTGGSSHARESDVIGAEATVILTIPSHGVGSISYEAAGSRFTSPARSMAGTEIRQAARVIVRERDGQVLVVVPR